MSKHDYTYQNALKLLRSRRRQQRPTTEAIGRSDLVAPGTENQEPSNVRGTPSYVGMRTWLGQIGHSEVAVDDLKIIHIAGTKGKGSTCAFAEAFLKAHSQRTGYPDKYGLYTSPSLQEEVERIRVNSKPVSKQQFTENLFEVWDRLVANVPVGESLPKFLQLLLLVGIHIFIKEEVKVAIIETHHGGQYDSTNIFQRPIATGITTIGFDHVAQLGPTMSDIAWHKAGIFKSGRPAFATSCQPKAVSDMLLGRATELNTRVKFISNDPHLPANHPSIKPEVQRLNCSLAKALVCSFLEQETPTESLGLDEQDINNALGFVDLPGRFQKLTRGAIKWYIDGAHNTMSIGNPVSWFSRDISTSADTSIDNTWYSLRKRLRSCKILIFSHISTERDGREVLSALIESVKSETLSFDHIIFCYDEKREDGSSKHDLNSPITPFELLYETTWKAAALPGIMANTQTFDEAYSHVLELSSNYDLVNVLVTGSFHIVGKALARLDDIPDTSASS